MIDLIEITESLDENQDIHLARLLVLLLAFREADKPTIEGITKLAKLDFLLRYPACLKTALSRRGVNPRRIPVEDFEALTIEARMVRYRFGPWDHRYRNFLNNLAARNLVKVGRKGNTIEIDLTDVGAQMAERLAGEPEFSIIYERAVLLKKHLNLKARALMEFIYETFPELSSLEYNEGIDFREEAS